MPIKNQFNTYAKDYDKHNIIQKIIAKSLLKDVINKPKNILELGCGSGQIFKNISWDINSYEAVDLAPKMCELHPRKKNINISCFDFDSKEFKEHFKNSYCDAIISSSALQWSKDLDTLLKFLSTLSNYFYASAFTSNTFKSMQNISKQKSPILSKNELKESFSKYFEVSFEEHSYNLHFESKKEMFGYLKKSGVNVKSELDFASARYLYENYKQDFLEFEVLFVKAKSKTKIFL